MDYLANIHFPLCHWKNVFPDSTVFGLGHMTCFGDRAESEKRFKRTHMCLRASHVPVIVYENGKPQVVVGGGGGGAPSLWFGIMIYMP